MSMDDIVKRLRIWADTWTSGVGANELSPLLGEALHNETYPPDHIYREMVRRQDANTSDAAEVRELEEKIRQARARA